jgi:hypothetical protein
MQGAVALHGMLLSTARARLPLVTELVVLHQAEPDPDSEYAVCRGCDKADAGQPDATWPCRTYEHLARGLLRIDDVEATIDRLARSGT